MAVGLGMDSAAEQSPAVAVVVLDVVAVVEQFGRVTMLVNNAGVTVTGDFEEMSYDDFDWIVRDDPTDPKGFYRVDRQLPFQERLTGLAAAA